MKTSHSKYVSTGPLLLLAFFAGCFWGPEKAQALTQEQAGDGVVDAPVGQGTATDPLSGNEDPAINQRRDAVKAELPDGDTGNTDRDTLDSNTSHSDTVKTDLSGKGTIIREIEFRLRRKDSNTDSNIQSTGKAAGPKDQALLSLARQIVYIRKGDTLSPNLVTRAVENLKLSKKFSHIEMDSHELSKGLRLTFLLTPAVYIKSIHIEGEYPLFESDVLNAMSLYPGDIYHESDLPEQEKRIRDLYAEDGFPRAKVDVSGRWSGKYRRLTVRIRRGPARILTSLQVKGNRTFSDFRIKWGFSAWRAGLLPYRDKRFKEPDFKTELEALRKKYWNRALFNPSLAEARISAHLEYSEDSLKVRATIEVEEGPRYRVELEGNQALSRRKLKKHLVFQTRGNANNLGSAISKKNIVEAYADRGFLDASVRVTDSLDTLENLKRLTFHIAEGPQSIIKSVAFHGIQFLTAEQLWENLLSGEGEPFVPEVWGADVMAVRSAYRHAGFPNVSLTEKTRMSEDKKSVHLSLTVEENGRKTVGKVESRGYENILSPEEVWENIETSTGEPYRKSDLLRDAQALEEAVSEKGYPHVTVSADTAGRDNSEKIHITYNIKPGPRVVLEEYHFSGNFKTKDSYLKREVDLPLREPLSLKKLLQGQKNLQDHAIFKSVHLMPLGLQEKAKRIHLFIEVEEQKPRYLQAGGGYESVNGFFTQAKFGDRNLWGANKHVWISGGIRQIGLPELGYEVATGLINPKLFHTKISASLDLYYKNLQKRNLTFRTKTFGTSTSFNRRFFNRILGGLTFVYENREVEGEVSIPEGTDSLLVLEAAQRRNALVTTPSLLWDTRNSFIRPQSGFFSSLSVDLSLGMDNQLDDFNRYTWELKQYLTPFSRLTIALAGRAEFIHSRHDNVIVSPDQLFYSGGTNSVRGFAENRLYQDEQGNPVGGERALVLNVEPRVTLGLGFEAAFFWDAGQLHNRLISGLKENYRMALGTGLRYLTPIGPVGILYGHKLFRRSGEALGQWHFSLGYTF